MKILQICNKFPYPPKDGGVIATFSLLKGFYNTGNSVTVAAINTSKHYTNPNDLPQHILKMAQFHSVGIDTSLKPSHAISNLVFSKLPYTATRFISKDFAACLTKILKADTFDIIQLEGLYVCPYIPLIRKYSKAKIAYRAHNVEFEIWERLWKETLFFPKRRYLKNLASRIRKFEISYINSYDLLLPITKRDGDFYNDLGNTKPTYVVPTGIFTDEMQPVYSQSKSISLFHIGGLDWAPNQQGIIWFLDNCWNQLYSQFPDISFKIAGRNAPQWFIEKLNMPGVEFVGEVESAKDFMAQNTIMVVPLLAGSGMRIKIIEGLAYGKAIVSTSIGAEGIPAKNNVEICIANTSNEFSEAIISLIKNNELCASIEKNAVNFVSRNFDNKTITLGLLDFYKLHGSSY